MKINVRDSSRVLPSGETPRHALWLSKLDRAIFADHVPSVYFYRPNGCNNFFDTKVMKESLGRALVHFYPLAGRLRRRQDGPLEIDCNGGGVLFVQADAEGEIDDFGDFAPSMELRQLVPEVDYQNQDISSYPLLLLQVRRSRAGGWYSSYSGGCMWSHTFYELLVPCGSRHGGQLPPIIDRTILRARDPPRTTFEHLEYMPPTEIPSKQKPQNAQLVGAIFRFNRDQLARLKETVNEGNTSTTKYSTFNSLVVHLWRCVSLANGLDDLQPTKLFIPVDGRKRLRPEIPNHYLGNAVFNLTLTLVSGDVKSLSMHYAASKIQEAILRMDDDYLRSALDSLELQPDLRGLLDMAGLPRICDLSFSSMARLPVHDADFGWGKPIHMGVVNPNVDGLGYILPSPSDDGSLSVVITLQTDTMRSLKKLIYYI